MIEVLKNPLTSNYHKLKEIILSDNFHWENIISTMDVVSNTEGHIHMPVDIHTFIPRPETTQEYNNTSTLSRKNGDAERESKSEYVDLCVTVMNEILDYSNLFGTYIFHRAAANCTYADEGIVDHEKGGEGEDVNVGCKHVAVDGTKGVDGVSHDRTMN